MCGKPAFLSTYEINHISDAVATEWIKDHEMQRHQTKFPNTNTNDREIETLLRCDATQREQTVDQAEQRDG